MRRENLRLIAHGRKASLDKARINSGNPASIDWEHTEQYGLKVIVRTSPPRANRS
jgi:hypothetical protein